MNYVEGNYDHIIEVKNNYVVMWNGKEKDYQMREVLEFLAKIRAEEKPK